MLVALMGGRALTATELSLEADIAPQTASSHLSKLLTGGLLIVRKQGRHKYFQLKDAGVAELIEQILNISASMLPDDVFTGPKNEDLRNARICYDHLAGELGVQLFDALKVQGYLQENYAEAMLTKAGYEFFGNLGVDFNLLKKSRRPLCKSCLDWSERRSHLAGSLGKWVLLDTVKHGWANQDLNSRALHFTQQGIKSFRKRYGIQSSKTN